MAADDDNDRSEDGPHMVPIGRLNQALNKASRLQDKLDEATSELVGLRKQSKRWEREAGNTDTLTKQIADLQAELEAERTGRKEDSALRDLGLEDPALVRFEHGRSGFEGSLVEWLETLKGKPDDAPAAFRAQLQALQGDEDEANEDEEDKGNRGQRRRGTTTRTGASEDRQPSSTTSTSNRQKLARLRDEAVRTGDWSAYKRARGFDRD